MADKPESESVKAEVSDPRLPWEVPASGKLDVVRAKPMGRGEEAARFARVGRIDVLSKIAELRGELANLHRENNRLKLQTVQLEMERRDLLRKIANLEHQIEIMKGTERKVQESQEQIPLRTITHESRAKATRSEKGKRESVQGRRGLVRTQSNKQ